jgi:hypothetical protein
MSSLWNKDELIALTKIVYWCLVNMKKFDYIGQIILLFAISYPIAEDEFFFFSLNYFNNLC